jgi:hypothetical protein
MGSWRCRLTGHRFRLKKNDDGERYRECRVCGKYRDFRSANMSGFSGGF